MQNDVDDISDDEAASVSEAETEELSLFDANMKAFMEHMPSVYAKLKDHKPVSELKYLDDGDMNVHFEGVPVFSKGARAEADHQLSNVNAFSSRLSMSMSEKGLDNYAAPAYSKVLQRAAQSGINFANVPIRTECYFLIVFGVGLGLHLDRLVEMTNCRSLALIEPNVDFLYHSCFVYDWGKLLERMQSRGSIDLMLTTDPEESAARVHRIFRRDNPICFDGTMVFRHYRSSVTQGIERLLRDSITTAVMGLGFFQDEINMIAQTYKNLEHGTARMMKKMDRSAGMPCFVVGNGPSLEKLLPFIKEKAEDAVIISCGSALETLLGAGIVPDFWVMMERGDLVLSLAQGTAEKFDVSQIRFVGSTTIFPGTQDLFKEPILFFRPGLSSTPLFALQNDQILMLPDPLSANAGLAVAAQLGFRELYLAGVDVGSRRQEKVHTPGGWYNRLSEPYGDLSLSVRGNFGGEVWTTPTLQWSKENLERLIKTARGRTFYNLSDGALIAGAVPVHRKAAKIPKLKGSKEAAIREIVDACPYYEKSSFKQRWEEVALVDSLFEFREELKNASEDMSDFKYEFEIARQLRPNLSDDALVMLLRGTLFTFSIACYCLENRLLEPDERAVLDNIVIEEFAALIDRMSDRASEVFLEVEAGAPWQQFEI